MDNVNDQAKPGEIAPRPLSDTERGVLESLLAQDFDGAVALRSQLPHANVVGACTCGCVTVALAVDKETAEPAAIGGRLIRAEATILDDMNEPIGGVIVFLRDGYLSMLEAYSYGDPISAWPEPDRLNVFLRDV
ncbi:MAG TPA: hypothetical protein VI434_11100 [Candidatus Dormibacteraeota bacterium]